MDPAEAERRYGAMLEEAGLPRFASRHHDPDIDSLELTWEHGLTIHLDLTRELDPIDDWEREAILGRGPAWAGRRPADRGLRPGVRRRPAHRHLHPRRGDPPRGR